VVHLRKIQIITDSSADIPAELVQQLGIRIVPLKVHFGSETYLDGVTIKSEEFYVKLAQSAAFPTTSQPSPVEFLDMYKELADQPGTQLISVHLSSALSGTYQSAMLAKSLLEDKADITIIDSKTASYGIGMLVVAAAQAANAGSSKEECLALIQRLRDKLSIYFLVDTFEYLQKGGRIGKASAFLGSLLNIKPILTVDVGGEVTSVDKVRGQKKAMQRIVELLKADHADGTQIQVVIGHTNAQHTAEELIVLIKENFQVTTITFTNIGPAVGAHVGPGTVAVFACPV
jgi:DegV family protein with EDD domain